ncbi:RNA polymerase sigma factor RpoD [Clostridium botulinum CFSAN002367]|nr:RNA polymerase sigma factor RpoD [Clostridium botulinum A1 str. CFSAN002368]EPS48497.1 RNA polymerase sigma factor RpoD [Clostridium botulinum CFSAN002367]
MKEKKNNAKDKNEKMKLVRRLIDKGKKVDH